MSSLSGFHGSRGTLSYTASKFAVRGMTKVAAIELGEWGIRVNSLHPGGVRTPMVAEASAKLGITSVDSFYEHLPVGRIGEPEDIARVALFLASDDSGYCTGSEFVVDGGEMAGTSWPALGPSTGASPRVDVRSVLEEQGGSAVDECSGRIAAGGLGHRRDARDRRRRRGAPGSRRLDRRSERSG